MRSTRLDGVKSSIGMRRHDQSPHGRIAIMADHRGIRVVVLRQPFGFRILVFALGLVLHLTAERGRRAHEASPGNVHIAANGEKREQGVPYLQAVGILIDSQPHGKRGGFFGQAARSAPDVIGIDAGDPRNVFDRILPAPPCQFVEAVCPPIHEIVIVKAFFYDHIEQPDGQCAIRPRTQLEMVFGSRGKPIHPGVGHNQLAATLHHLYH